MEYPLELTVQYSKIVAELVLDFVVVADAHGDDDVGVEVGVAEEEYWCGRASLEQSVETAVVVEVVFAAAVVAGLEFVVDW